MSTRACVTRPRSLSSRPDPPGSASPGGRHRQRRVHLTVQAIRLFASAGAIRSTGAAFLAATLPKAQWTHEAHLATCGWLIEERPDIAPERDLPRLIRAYNEAVGGVNDDSQGYHETLTQHYIAGVRDWLSGCAADGLLARINGLLSSPVGNRAWPLGFYTRERLFSVEARRTWVKPDIA